MPADVYCLDSDVIIWHLRSGGRAASVRTHLARLAETATLACSVLSVAEVEQGARPDEIDRTRRFLRALKCYPVDRAVAEAGGELVRELRASGRTLGLADALIAATAKTHDLTLVTLNVRDFSAVPDLLLETVP